VGIGAVSIAAALILVREEELAAEKETAAVVA
jgi:hypothetical protein